MDATGLPSGTVYPALRRLEDSGFVRSSWEPHARAERAKRPRRRYYEVTASGVTALEAARRRFPWLGAVGSTSATGAEPSKA
ncbi:MAG: PadR family transcriptional regulator [Acidobacteria bacterium]|nr:MAG: PadR family transcriptional regulator [Acidobacteriota bacterium]REK05955.1 MAG: PadR family transcriptional regulator [Acidobacteriota bacterium]